MKYKQFFYHIKLFSLLSHAKLALVFPTLFGGILRNFPSLFSRQRIGASAAPLQAALAAQ
jgi:hypothetical protein